MAETTFKSVFDGIADKIKDFTTLEVTLYKGSIKIAAVADLSKVNFDTLLQNAKSEANFRVVATTKSELDGDTETFIDDGAEQKDLDTHQKLLENAIAKRAAILNLFQSSITKALG